MSSMEDVKTVKVRPLIDLLNLLHSAGIQQDLELPKIAVIGDRNSGKSSVLEALSGVALPRGRGYTVVLQMNKTKGVEWNCIVRWDSYSNTETRIVPQNRYDMPGLITKSKRNDSHMVTLEITSADVPDLTLIDLPSIRPIKNYKDIYMIRSVIRKKISNPECIILMVAPCNVDITTTGAFKMAQEVDPDGARTLVLLTKPDVVDQVKAKIIVDTVQNKVINLQKGFMIVRCYAQPNTSLMDPIERELQFFKEHDLFKSLYDEGYATLPKLAERLSQELAQHTEKCLPQLKEYVKKELLQANAAIKRFGKPPPSDEGDMLPFLTDKINTFIRDVMRLTSGELLDLTDQRVISVWRKIVMDSEESLQCKLEAEVALHEESVFCDFQIFELMIKDNIALLEEPAVISLKHSADLVTKELVKLAECAFFGFPNLFCKAQSALSDVILSCQKAAETVLRFQFKMEQFEVQAERRIWSNKKRGKKSGMTAQVYSSYQTLCQHLTSQFQMTIRYHMIKESSTELQKMMLQIQNNKNISDILKYDQTLTTQRHAIQKCFIPLTKAQVILSEL